ncbi:MAG: PhzF family phenazine biosynthesis protein [Ignavibacteria bacterium]|nr:PhzF family phenazine biosynthesis protein [Ignavibacteria bacterium]
MMLPFYQADAFTDSIFGGNPAAICILTNWLPEEQLQKIASENNLSETAFVKKKDSHYEIRWFTPTTEVALCGHATLASAYVLFEFVEKRSNQIVFESKFNGQLLVSRDADLITLDFPTDYVSPITIPDELIQGLGVCPIACYKGRDDILAVFSTQKEIENLQPNFSVLSQLPGRGVIITAKGDQCDFVSRYFAPQSGINEDPVTGSAHTTLTPYWAKMTGKTKFSAVQLSSRKGKLSCEYCGERVKISGKVVLYCIGDIFI